MGQVTTSPQTASPQKTTVADDHRRRRPSPQKTTVADDHRRGRQSQTTEPQSAAVDGIAADIRSWANAGPVVVWQRFPDQRAGDIHSHDPQPGSVQFITSDMIASQIAADRGHGQVDVVVPRRREPTTSILAAVN